MFIPSKAFLDKNIELDAPHEPQSLTLLSATFGRKQECSETRIIQNEKWVIFVMYHLDFNASAVQQQELSIMAKVFLANQE